jgi:hypothetical protein
MLKKSFLYFFISLLGFISIFLSKFLYIKKNDINEYKALAEKKLDFKPDIAYQKRKDVQKDLFVVDKTTRKHYVIASKDSDVFLDKKNLKYEIIEDLNEISFQAFEDLENLNLKDVKYITAKTGKYLFPIHKLNLYDIDMHFIHSQNFNDMSLDNSYFQGKAKELNLTIHKKEPKIKAKQFEGYLNFKKPCIK